MTLFISHAVADQQLVSGLETLLQVGVGVPHSEIFRSSRPGSIPNGEYFVQHILGKLQAANMIVSVISRSYFKSQFCVAELGAARAQRMADNARFFSLIIPPVDYSELHGVLHGVQSGEINTASALDELRDGIATETTHFPSTAVWNNARDTFLDTARSIVNRHLAAELLKQLTLQDVFYERSEDPKIRYKLKVRIVLRNETGEDLDVVSVSWNAGSDDARLQLPEDMGLEPEGNLGWEHGSWLEGGARVYVPAGRTMRAWVGLAPFLSDDELRRRHETRQLGTLNLSIRITGYEESVLQIPL